MLVDFAVMNASIHYFFADPEWKKGEDQRYHFMDELADALLDNNTQWDEMPSTNASSMLTTVGETVDSQDLFHEMGITIAPQQHSDEVIVDDNFSEIRLSRCTPVQGPQIANAAPKWQ